VHEVEVDVTCTGRFYDFFEQRAGRWAIVRRQPIYEQDRLDVLDPAGTVRLDPAPSWTGSPSATATWPTCSGRGYE